MVEIMSAESVARETLKMVLENEIPLVNKAIEKAKEDGLRTTFVKRNLSAATKRLLKKAGYYVDDDITNSTEISWEAQYNNLITNDKFIEKVAEEIDIRIVDCDCKGNKIDPNWQPPKFEDD